MTIVYTPGVWDLLHYGHINVLNRAKEHGSHLVAGICSDRVCRLFGKTPVTDQNDRAAVVAALKSVDQVHIYDDADQTSVLKHFCVDVFVIGEDFGHQGVPQHATALAFCEANHIPVVRVNRSPGVSSSDLKRQVAASERAAVIKHFWASRARKVKDDRLGLWQSTSLTSSNENAEQRREADLNAILNAIGRSKQPKGCLLEIGCGVGRLTMELAGHFKKIYASDFIGEFIATARTQLAGRNVELFEAEAHEFDRTISYNYCLLAGVLVSLSDSQFEKVLRAISYIPTIVLKESIGTISRYELPSDHFSKELDTTYTGIYRTAGEIATAFADHGYRFSYSEMIERHRQETNLQVFLFEK